MNHISSHSQDASSSIRVLDEYYQHIPEDLYIPPEAFAILLEQFEGPLDFLLYIVQKNGFDLKHLDIAPIAEQYIGYMHKMKSLNIELTADYMVMAALLADIKSRLLLPKPEVAPQFEKDPQKDLIVRLEQYLKIKQAAERLGQHHVLERDVFDTRVGVGKSDFVHHIYDVQSLHDAMLCVFQRPEPVTHHIQQEEISLEERMQYICEKVAEGGVLDFETLLKPSQGRVGIVVTFMAVLELIKQQYLQIVHDGSQHQLSIQGSHHV